MIFLFENMVLNYFIFTLVFLYTFLWVIIKLVLSSLGKKTILTIVQNKEISDLIFKKTGIKISSIKIAESKRPFGMMVGIPGKPQLILSKNLHDTFSPKELEYVVLHETGHYKLQHSLIEFMAAFLLFILGFYLITIFNNSISALVIGLIFGTLLVQLAKIHELQADSFTLKLISDPEGMIKATEKFRNFYGRKYSENKNKILQFLFYRGNPYDNRIMMARNEMNNRKRK